MTAQRRWQPILIAFITGLIVVAVWLIETEDGFLKGLLLPIVLGLLLCYAAGAVLVWGGHFFEKFLESPFIQRLKKRRAKKRQERLDAYIYAYSATLDPVEYDRRYTRYKTVETVRHLWGNLRPRSVRWRQPRGLLWRSSMGLGRGLYRLLYRIVCDP
jgi:hypothetical protein